ncbi:SET DOMAIN GROUP 40 [Micractinium conductrix]|uniref:SET DOMAIN GROUP 40 n=1 Tax=Micractinium conductrix TaxID=554055 RepID=A0A2P6VRL9_9CHLO|nr:SET DOMAIN GROUP 40 [Micractinium conductrix]|eukprot:PSC76715.1 SET DOMAIN GROUP 40 [Micractinium conductrix]
MCFTEEEAAALQAEAAVEAARGAAAAAAAAHARALPLLSELGLPPKWRSRGAWLPPPSPYAPSPGGLRAAARALAAAAGGWPAEAGTAEAAAQAADASLPGGADAAGAAEGIAGDGHLDEAADEYCIFARTRYSPGEQVFLCYGRHTNLQLVQHYGFVLPPGQNPHDTAPLPPHLLPPAVQQQLAACGGGGGGSGGAAARPAAAAAAGEGGAYLHASGAPSWELLRALRLGCASPAERKAGACRALADEPISAASERGGFDALRTACGAALAALPASIDQDEAKLAALRRRAAGQPPDAQSQQQQQQEQAAEHGAEQQQPAQQPSNAAELQRRAQQALQQERWRAEKLALAVEWRLGYKRTLKQGIALCDAVLGILSFGNAPAARAGRAASGDITARLAALQRRPRW